MKPDVAAAIRDLLFEHDEVVIPGLGAFEATYLPATVDHVQGHLMPPSRKITFNASLTIDDGRLAAWLIERYGLSANEAREAIQQYVQEVKDRLARKESWELPHLGKLYRDFEGNYRFEQRATKFQVASFGLPEFDARPVVAATPEAPTHTAAPEAETPKKDAPGSAITAATPAPTTQSPPPSPTTAPAVEEEKADPLRWLYRLLPVLLVLALGVVLFSIYLVYFGGEEAGPAPPAPTEQAVPPAAEDEPEDLADFEEEAIPSEVDVPDTEAPTPPPDQHETFVVLHSFGKERNAARFAERLVNDGYNAASVQDGRLIRVGVRFAWRDSSELQSMIEALGKQYKTTPRVWEE